jgi:hypothetical protein
VRPEASDANPSRIGFRTIHLLRENYHFFPLVWPGKVARKDGKCCEVNKDRFFGLR